MLSTLHDDASSQAPPVLTVVVVVAGMVPYHYPLLVLWYRYHQYHRSTYYGYSYSFYLPAGGLPPVFYDIIK